MSKVSIEWQPGNPHDRSITGFRIRQGNARGPMSRAFYYKMKARGDGPRETYLSPGRVLITAKDEAAWLEAKSNPQGTEARLAAKASAEMRKARAQKAGKAAVASPLHRSHRWRRARAAMTASTENLSPAVPTALGSPR